MKKISRLMVALLLAQIMVLAGCESRQHSILRENGYVRDHQVEAVAHYWDHVVYAVADGTTLAMDISAPDSKVPLPCVMIIHGGGWELHTNTVMEGMARYLTNRGYVVFNINYRVLPDLKLEQIVDDSMGALIWVKEHAADYGGDPSRVAVTGDSAGGHLTAMIVTRAGNPKFKPTYAGNGKTDLSITCAAPSYGVFDFVELSKQSGAITKHYLKESYKKDPERYELLSPALNVKKGLPPQLLIVGSEDALVGPQTYIYADKLKAAGDPVEVWVYPGQGHAFLNNFWDERGTKGFDRILKFFDEQMKK